MYAHRNALGKAHPSEDRVDAGQTLPVRDVDGVRDAFDMATKNLVRSHQLDGGGITFLDRTEIGLLEIGINPERVDVDDRDSGARGTPAQRSSASLHSRSLSVDDYVT
jgi:hypothetical protein